MSSWGMNPESLNGAGRQLGGLDVDAQSAVNGFTGSLGDAIGAVKHRTLITALEGFREDHTTAGKRLVHNVSAAGSQVSKVAVTGAQGDADIASGLRPVTGGSVTTQTELSRDINA